MHRVTRTAAIFAAVILFFTAPVRAQDLPLSGDWTLDRARSEFPPEIGFPASFMPAAPVPDNAGGGGRGRGRRAQPQTYSRPDSEDDARRIQQLTDAVRTPPINLTIEDASSSVTITADGHSRTFHPDGKQETIDLGNLPVAVVTTRVAAGIVVLYDAAPGRQVRYTYWRAPNSTQLVVDAAFVDRGETESIRRVYVPGTATVPAAPTTAAAPSSAPRSSGAPSSGAPPSGAPSSGVPAAGSATSAPIDNSPNAALKGLTKLGVVVDDLSTQAASCGLTRGAIESAVSKSISDAGLTAVNEMSSDVQTYLYVNVMTTSASSGLCVSRYDVFLYTHTAAKLPYHDTPVLVQVLLAHKGGLAGAGAAAHAESVMRGIKEYADEFLANIRDANK